MMKFYLDNRLCDGDTSLATIDFDAYYQAAGQVASVFTSTAAKAEDQLDGTLQHIGNHSELAFFHGGRLPY